MLIVVRLFVGPMLMVTVTLVRQQDIRAFVKLLVSHILIVVIQITVRILGKLVIFLRKITVIVGTMTVVEPPTNMLPAGGPIAQKVVIFTLVAPCHGVAIVGCTRTSADVWGNGKAVGRGSTTKSVLNTNAISSTIVQIGRGSIFTSQSTFTHPAPVIVSEESGNNIQPGLFYLF